MNKTYLPPPTADKSAEHGAQADGWRRALGLGRYPAVTESQPAE